jgi:hypothetical protein
MTETEPTPPKLAPPGTGIPIYQKLFLRLYVNPFVAGREPIEKMRARAERKHENLRDAYLAIPEGLRAKKVLVPPQTGLEDSSRYWSAAMVLEHVEIVGSAMVEVMAKLKNGQVPEVKADTATVKPHGVLTADKIFASYERWRAGVFSALDTRGGDFKSSRTFGHPWFGAFSARKWLWVLGIHAELHIKQLAAIRLGLGLPKSPSVPKT